MKVTPFLIALVVPALAGCARAAGPAPTTMVAIEQPAVPADSAGSPTEDEVTRQAVEVFGDSMSAPEPEPAPGGEEVAEVPTWDIDVRSYETHERVEHFVKLFSGPARDRIGVRLSRGSKYQPMIRAKFRAAGLPEDMTYLALVESGYNHDAYSRAAAVGMWQFMTTTARGFGLRVDWWVDERRDPVRSTDAAIRFLKALNEQFGSLYVAAAAYNGGPGRLARGLTRFADDLEGTSGDDLFFALSEKKYLPTETKNYVPQIIAAALVAKEPVRYGITVDTQPVFAYDSVRVGPTTPLAAVAKASGSTTDEIVALNPHILRGMTPPKDSSTVRVPVGRATTFDSAFASLTDEELKPFIRVTSKKGERLADIASRSKLTAKQVAWFNPRLSVLKSGRLTTGQTILVPSAAVAAAARDVPDPAVERYGSNGGRVTTHVVRPGENLSIIARKRGTTVADLRRRNGLKKDVIFPGQTLIVRGGSAPTRRSASSGRASSGSVHIVRSGDTLGEIAERYGTTVSALKRKNGLSSSNIRIGQKLVVR